MGQPVVANVFKSGAVIWRAPVGEAVPDETTVNAGSAWGGTWVRVGFTSEPVAVMYEQTTVDIGVDDPQYLAPLDRARTAETLAIETVLAELTADYLQMAAGGGTITTTAAAASQKGYEEFNVGGQPSLSKYAFGIEGIRYNDANIALPIRMFIPRATVRMNGNLTFTTRGDDQLGIPIRIEGLAGTASGAEGRIFTFQRVLAAATA